MKGLRSAVVVAAVTFGTAGVSYGFRSFATEFKNTYPASPLSALSTTSGVAGNLCTVCHGPSGPPLNPFGDAFLNNGTVFPGLESLDSDGDTVSNISEINAGTFPGDPNSKPFVDSTRPTVISFTIPATATSLIVAIDSFSGSDDTGVTGYLVTESAAPPQAGGAGWGATAPTSYTFASAGAKTLYAWVKDAAGNVSPGVSAGVTITLADFNAPIVTGFSVAAAATSLTVPITAFAATDDVAVTGYLVTETATPPLAGAPGWTGTAPTSFTFASAGAKTLYAWAKDAAGNVSASLSAGTAITLLDTTAPIVTAFSIPGTSTVLTVPITAFSATDDLTVTGYLVTESEAVPSAGDPGWSGTAPTSFTFASAGAKTLYAWAKDAAGNVSASLSASTSIAPEGNAGEDPDSGSDEDPVIQPGRCGANVGPANLIAFYALAWVGLSIGKFSVRGRRVQRASSGAACTPVLGARNNCAHPAPPPQFRP